MVEFPRKIFKKDPNVLGQLHDLLVENHKVANHTKKVLLDNKHIDGFCEDSRCFVVLQKSMPLYIHYDVSTWIMASNEAVVKINSIGVYGSFIEYEKARLSQLHSGKKADIPNIN